MNNQATSLIDKMRSMEFQHFRLDGKNLVQEGLRTHPQRRLHAISGIELLVGVGSETFQL